jgi:flap endonuclease-1
MGIKGLMQVLKDEAPNSFKETSRKSYNGKIVAIDASMQLYQFMIQIKMENEGGFNNSLTNENGEITSHLMGILNRTVNLLELGIKPVYVFDGKPPSLKLKELSKRKEMKKKAEEKFNELSEQLASASISDDENDKLVEEMNKMSKRSVTITKENIDDTKKLLDFIGIPWIQAPCEAEAQCADLVKNGKVYATATEDMDCLTFGSNVMLKNLTDPKKNTIEISLDKVLLELKMSKDEFIDFCILCGCDYTDSIKGIGPKRGLALIRKFKSIDEILKNIDNKKYPPSDSLVSNLNEVRSLFASPEITDHSEINIKFGKVKEKELIDFLVSEKGFNRERLLRIINKINKKNAQSGQNTIDKYFK